MKTDYFNYESINLYKFWSDQDWPYVIRWYDLKTGVFDYKKSLNETNKHSNITYKFLPKGSFY